MAKKNVTGAKKTDGKKKTGKKAGKLAAVAARAGRTLGRAAKGVDKARALAKKSLTGKRAKKAPKKDPELEAQRARDRETWKKQAKEAASVELSKQGALVDERARVRATTGMSWSNRKPR